MKIVLEEYIRSLREKDELDILLCDMLTLDGYSIYNKPRSGERQYGVDVLAQKNGNAYLFVIKQKDITRSTWDSGPDSVRQSLNDIFDVYLPTMLPQNYCQKTLNIVLVTNGYLQSTVQPNWNGYQKQYTNYNGIPVIFNVWNIDELVHLCDRVAFNEKLFDSEVQSILRKALYFMDEQDFSNKYFESIVDYYINNIFNCVNKNKKKKIIVSFFACIFLINSWAKNIERYTIAIEITEYALIKTWKLICDKSLFGEKEYMDLLFRLINLYKEDNEYYIKELDGIADTEYGLAVSNPLENRMITFEAIGRICTYGIFLTYFYGKNKGEKIVKILIRLLNNNPMYKYPLYDNNIIQLSILFLFIKQNRPIELKIIIHNIVQGIVGQYMHGKTIPSPNDDFDEALEIFYGLSKPEYEASVLLGGLFEWICIEELDLDFKQLCEICKVFKNITCQTWQMNVDEEISLFSNYYAFQTGYSVPISHDKSIKEVTEELTAIDKKIDFSNMLFNQYSFAPIAIIASRYYNNPVLPQFWRQFDKWNT